MRPDQDCITDMTEFNTYTKYPNHILDNSQGWHYDPSLRVECFDIGPVHLIRPLSRLPLRPPFKGTGLGRGH